MQGENRRDEKGRGDLFVLGTKLNIGKNRGDGNIRGNRGYRSGSNSLTKVKTGKNGWKGEGSLERAGENPRRSKELETGVLKEFEEKTSTAGGNESFG